MGTAVVEDENAVGMTSVMAHRDAIGRWHVVVGGDGLPSGVAHGNVGESFDVVFDAAIADLRLRRRVAA